MKDKLKGFIEANRNAFDDSDPSPELPGRILAAHERKKRSEVRRMPWTSLAAATFTAGLLLAMARLYLPVTDNTSHDSLTGGEAMSKAEGTLTADSSLRRIDPARALQLEAISREAMARQSELESLRKDDPELYQRFLQDLAVLDSHYIALRDMLERMPNQHQVMQAMEENLRTRLDMLERQGHLIREAREWKKPRS